MVNSSATKDPAPPIAIGTAYILQQVIYQNQELMCLLSAKCGKSVRKNTNRNPTPSTGPCQGQPCHPIPVYFEKYWWTHGRGIHKGVNCNSKAPGHNDKATMEIRMDGRNYGCTEWWCGVVPKVETNNNRNTILKSTYINLFPPNVMSYNHVVLNKSCKTIILKSDTGAAGNYIRVQDTIILENPGPKTTVPRARLPDNSIIQLRLPAHIPLPVLPSRATQAHTYPNLKSASLLSIGQLCDSNCFAIFKKSTSSYSTQTILLYSIE